MVRQESYDTKVLRTALDQIHLVGISIVGYAQNILIDFNTFFVEVSANNDTSSIKIHLLG